MTTVRLQIVDAIATAIAAVAAPAGANNYRNLDHALAANRLPAIVILDGEDAVDSDVASLNQLFQVAEIEFHILVANSETPAASADPFEAAIHGALMTPTSFASHPVRVERIGGTWQFGLGDCADREIRYRVRYITRLDDIEAS